jgi:hypothetical protein
MATDQSINFSRLGFTGPSSFAAAGDVEDVHIGANGTVRQDNNVVQTLDLSGGVGTDVYLSGGVFLGSENGPGVVDPVVYGTADNANGVIPGNGLLDTITIAFGQPIFNFSVKIFNGLPTDATYLISDNEHDSTTVMLGANNSSDPNLPSAKTITLNSPNLAPTSVTIESITPGAWDFSIDNINFNFSPADAQNPKNAVVAPILNLLLPSAMLLTELGELLTEGTQGNPGAAPNIFFSLQALLLIVASGAQAAVTDPFDPNYSHEYTPTFVQLPTIQPDSTVTQQTANDANAAISDFSTAVAYVQAVEVTMNRLSSAMQAGDQASVAVQNADLDTYLKLASSSLAAAGKDVNTLVQDFMGANLPSITEQDKANFLETLANGFAGLPQQEQNLFEQFGLSSADEQTIVNLMETAGFPNPNVPTSLVSVLQQVETSVLALGTVYGGNAPEADTTIPAVAVEGSMYNAVGTQAEIIKLATGFLPAQVANAEQNSFNPQVYACEALGLAFAFGDENGGTAFNNNFGPANTAMPATPAGDAAFAAAAASTIFGSAATANTPGAILQFVTNWEAFYTAHGVPGIPNATATQIDLAARGAAWGDAVGVALANSLGPLPGQVTNFLSDVVQGTAIYSASLVSQPQAAAAAPEVQLTGIAAPFDHVIV